MAVDPGIADKLLGQIDESLDRLNAALDDAKQEATFENLEARALATLTPEDQATLTNALLVGNRAAREQALTIYAEITALQRFRAAVRTVART